MLGHGSPWTALGDFTRSMFRGTRSYAFRFLRLGHPPNGRLHGWGIWSEANDERDQQVYSRKVVFQVRLHAAGGLCGPKACVPHSSA